jgi:hypothetical protein
MTMAATVSSSGQCGQLTKGQTSVRIVPRSFNIKRGNQVGQLSFSRRIVFTQVKETGDERNPARRFSLEDLP